ncbi:MAG: hypothetical protein GXO75_02860 [Calditrichaeota bacterium]|nr:hypothetical protein [Calditrichota bacterium]
MQSNYPVKRGQVFLVRFLLPLFLVGVIFSLTWLCPSAMSVVLWTLFLLSLLTRLLRLFNNRIVSWLFITVFLFSGFFFYLHSEKIENKTNAEYLLQKNLLEKQADSIFPYFHVQKVKIKAEIHDFSVSFVRFFLPGKRQIAIIFTLVLLLRFFSLKVFHGVLDKLSNSIFEFFAFAVAKVYHRLLDFFFYKSIEIAFVFLLWMLALRLLQFNDVFEIALAAGLSTLTPILGIWLVGLFPLLYVQTSDKMVVQIIGVIVTFAVMWLFRHIAISRVARKYFTDIKPLTVLVLLGAGYLFGNITGLLVIVPLFVFIRFLVWTFLQGKPLYNKHQKEPTGA